MNGKLICAFLVAVLYQTSSVQSYGIGAPSQACMAMTPGHLNSGNASDPILPQEGESPYSLSVNKEMVQRGQTVNVTVNGGAFQGCLIQARSGSNTVPVGTFSDNTPDNTKTTMCTAEGDSVTHANTNDKPDGTTFTWQAPEEEFEDIFFMATVATNHDVFWVGLQSDVVSDAGPPTIRPTTRPSTTSPAPWIVSCLSVLLSSLIAAVVINY